MWDKSFFLHLGKGDVERTPSLYLSQRTQYHMYVSQEMMNIMMELFQLIMDFCLINGII